jgi:hypothetical protein
VGEPLCVGQWAIETAAKVELARVYLARFSHGLG